jgi:hypothetical protein
MTNLTQEEQQLIASLVTIRGYKLLVDKVVRCNRDTALAQLKLADADGKTNAAYHFCAWDEVTKILEEFPTKIMEELKQQGDPVYG